MGLSEKIEADIEKAKGAAKEAAGKATHNERLVAEGKADQAKSDMKLAAEEAKDTTKDVFDK